VLLEPLATAILDYDAGNLTSVLRAVRHLERGAGGSRAAITRDPDLIRRAERIIFPGVGAAGAAMASLRRLGLDRALIEAHAAGKPILGICIGCQVIFESSEEDGGTPCLGLLRGRVVGFRFSPGVRRKVPHMGWNRIELDSRPHPVLEGIESGSEFYFVHSFYPEPADPAVVLGSAAYGERRFAALLAQGNLVAAQCHVEKSGPCGLRLLDNFLRWRP
jgi:glutamine amidotransferase